MTHRIAAIAIAASISSCCGGFPLRAQLWHLQRAMPAPPQLNVRVLPRIPPTTLYELTGLGNGPVRCTADQCEHYFLPAPDSVTATDKILRLLLPDYSIVVASCDAKEIPIVNLAIQTTKIEGDSAEVPLRRLCNAPDAGTNVNATFDGKHVRVFLEAPAANGAQPKLSSELYSVKAILKPLPQDPAELASSTRAYVSTIPLGAQVFLDGERLGISPLVVSIPANGAPHQFMVSKDGYKAIQHTIRPDADATRYEFILKPQP